MRRIIGLVSLGLWASAAPAATLFYAGDLSGVNLSEENFGPGSVLPRHFERLHLNSDSVVTGIYGHHFIGPTTTVRVEWDIRTGMSEGNGGTVLASSSDSIATVTPTGRIHPVTQSAEVKLGVAGLAVALGPGDFWVSLRPINTDASISGTTGVNGIGSTVGDHMSILHGSFFSANYHVQPFDWSYGVEGYAVPEPASILALSGLAGLLVRRQRNA